MFYCPMKNLIRRRPPEVEETIAGSDLGAHKSGAFSCSERTPLYRLPLLNFEIIDRQNL